MSFSPSFAWIYWDPSSVAFTIPYFDHPVAWYGISFVTGFILAYFLLQPIFRQFLWKSKCLLDRDILNWDALISQTCEGLRHKIPFHQSIALQLSQKERAELEQCGPSQLPSASLKRVLLAAFTQSMQQAPAAISRRSLEITFEGGITPVKELTTFYTDRLTWLIVLGTILGARLGHILFYDFPYYVNHPANMIKIWQGGLASHGGTLGVILSLVVFLSLYRKELPELSFVKLIDMLVIPAAIASTFIRIGNFINQEILGYPTTLPWAVVFGHPADGTLPEPRHPVSLYEAILYFGTFLLLYCVWKGFGRSLKSGVLGGLFFILVFGGRFFIDFLKLPQSLLIDESFLQMGQYLSLPFIALGLFLLFMPQRFLQVGAIFPSRSL